jgi:hypothetical protein
MIFGNRILKARIKFHPKVFIDCHYQNSNYEYDFNGVVAQAWVELPLETQVEKIVQND